MTKRFFLPFLTLVLVVFSGAAIAQEATDGTLRVVRPIIHAEQDVPELCLEFDHPLATAHPAKIAENIRLTLEGKTVPVSSKMLDITSSQLCVTLTEHRKTYRIALADMRGKKGEKLASAYSLSFVMPARQTELTFVNDGNDEGLMRGMKAMPVLRALNVTGVKLELFRLTDPARMVEAWERRRQTALAPSETATYARTNGTLVWQGKTTFDFVPDALVDQPLTLDGKLDDLPPGLYLIVASAPDLREKETDLAPVAATWLLRSSLRIHAQSDGQGLRVFAEKTDATIPAKGVRFSLFDPQQKFLAETVGDANGVATLTLKPDNRNKALIVMAFLDSGDVDFVDVSPDAASHVVFPSLQADAGFDKSFYAPGETVHLTLMAHDIHNRSVPTQAGEFHVLRADHSLYSVAPVPAAPDGKVVAEFSAPLRDGLWPVVWQQADGAVLAESSFRVSANPQAPHVEITADRSLLSQDGAVGLTIKSFDGANDPAAYVAGRVAVKWITTDHVFPGWKGYHFGLGGSDDKPEETVASFVTDAKGIARVQLNLSHSEDESQLCAAVIDVISDPASGAVDPPNLTLPLKPKDMIIGIKPSVAGGRFAENSLAHFDIVALGHDGNSKSNNDLSYHIYEIGRNFDWYQSEGAWQYKPLQQQRLIGDDDLAFSADGIAKVEWPVATGTYRLDVTDADGDKLASLDFSSGWQGEMSAVENADNLSLLLSHPFLTLGQQDKIQFTLAKPSVVTAIVADDHVRMIVHEARPVGVNELALTPSADWGNRVRVWIEARSVDAVTSRMALASGQIEMPVVAADSVPKAKPTLKPAPVPVKPIAVVPDEEAYVLKDTEHHVLASRQVLTMEAPAKPQDKKTPDKRDGMAERAILISALPINGLISMLSEVVNRIPFATQEIGIWLQTGNQWAEILTMTKILPKQAWERRKREMITRLAKRQNLDGSFPSQPDESGDLADTAAALQALSASDELVAKPVVDRAADWLRRRLENTWFDETERAERAAGYAALAAAGKLDAANLHYFSDSSADKNLPPLAALQLASAFAAIKDKDKTQFWLDAAKINKASPDIAPDLLPLLAANPAVNPEDVRPALEKLGQSLQQKPQSLSLIANFLVTIGHLQERSQAWEAEINGVSTKARTIEAITVSPKTPAMTIRNAADRPLYVTEAAMDVESGMVVSSPSLMRHIYLPTGGEVKDGLKKEGTYVVVIEGNQPIKSKTSLIIRDDVGAGLHPLTCALQNSGGNPELVWLSPTSVASCEVADGILEAVVTAGAAGPWRMVYLVRAEQEGSYDLAAPVAQFSDNRDSLTGERMRITIR